MNKYINEFSFAKVFESWAITENPINTTEDIIAWVNEKKRTTTVNIKKLKYDYNGEWYYDPDFGGIHNIDSSFFQIKGICRKNNGIAIHEQPIIIQDEIGFLGIVGKVMDGVLYFLMQAKIEPGNSNAIQISPTIQATKSNFSQAHGGDAPAYLDYFLNKDKYNVIIDQIQSEQSSRFLGKRNRNIVIIVEEDIKVNSSHKWMTLGQIKELMKYDNLVNMDTRTVLSCLPISNMESTDREADGIDSLFTRKSFYNSVFSKNTGMINKVFQYINDVKMLDNEDIELVDLFSLKKWRLMDGEFIGDNGEFKIIYCDIEIEGREVRHWQQPLFEAINSSVFGLMYRVYNGEMQFLVQAKKEIGCFDKIELGPSIQLHERDHPCENPVTTLFMRKLNNKENIDFDGLFSEEGGRFYHEENRNVIMGISEEELPDEILPKNYFWCNYHTLNILVQFNNYLNIQLRNLLSVLDI